MFAWDHYSNRLLSYLITLFSIGVKRLASLRLASSFVYFEECTAEKFTAPKYVALTYLDQITLVTYVKPHNATS